MIPRIALCLLSSLALLAVTQAAPASGGPRKVYFVRLAPGARSTPSALAARRGLAPRRWFRKAFPGFTAALTLAEARSLRDDPTVAGVYPDGPVSLRGESVEPLSASANKALSLKKQKIWTGVRRCGATESPTAAINGVDGDLDVDVAVLDTGADSSHPDLNVVGGFSTYPQGFIDENGHGTHVAGIIGARDNQIGVVGVAPGARIWAVRVLSASGDGSWEDVITGIEWVAEHADVIDVLNMSLGGTLPDQTPLFLAIESVLDAGVTVVVSAGNDAQDADNQVPSRFPRVITVSALADSNGKAGPSAGRFKWAKRTFDVDETLADFSNFGDIIDIAAPGVKILSTIPKKKYGYISGTSQAAPHVAGAAALYKLNHPGALPAEVRDALVNAGSAFPAPDDSDPIHEPALDASGL